MVVEELVSPGSLGAVDIEVVVSLELCFTTLEGPGVLLPLLTNLRMILEKILQLRMLRHPFLVVNQVGVFPELLGNFRMAVEELVSPGSLGAGDFSAAHNEPVRIVHKRCRVRFNLLCYPRMVVKESLELGMLSQIVRIVDQRRVLLKLLVHPRMIE